MERSFSTLSMPGRCENKLHGDDLFQSQSSFENLEEFIGIEGCSGGVRCQTDEQDTGEVHFSFTSLFPKSLQCAPFCDSFCDRTCYAHNIIIVTLSLC